MSGPLSGIRVIDVTTVLLGPYATQLLGDMGADVIKVEAPPKGDSTRYIGPARHPGMGGPFLNLNRNKRGIALDLKQEPAKEVLRRLIRTADVLVHNMRPQAIARLGFGYEAVRALKPDIVYCGAYGYSQKGPYRAKPAYDDLIQGASGLAGLFTRLTGEPRYVPTVLADKLVGLTVSQAVTMALFHRERTGEGQFVEVPMFETMVSFLMVEHLYGRGFEPPLGETGYGRLTTLYRKPYRSKDGYICMLPYSDRQWHRFFDAVGRPELMDDPRFADHTTRTTHVEALYKFLDEIAPQRTNAEWVALCEAAEIPVTPVNDLEDLLQDEHLAAVGLFQRQRHPSEGDTILTGPPVSLSKSPGGIQRPAPRLGEHGPELLRELGYGREEIEALVAEKALTKPDDVAI